MPVEHRKTAALLAAAVAFAATPGLSQTGPDHRIRASEVSLPDGVAPGQYQRTIRPFENWSLICDERIEARSKVCNVTQTVEDAAGDLVFSWSLAATSDGSPYMILRTAPVVPDQGYIDLDFPGRSSPVRVLIDGCSSTVCIGMVPVGPIMRGQIDAQSSPRISYPTEGESIVTTKATLAGLSEALSAIE